MIEKLNNIFLFSYCSHVQSLVFPVQIYCSIFISGEMQEISYTRRDSPVYKAAIFYGVVMVIVVTGGNKVKY